MSWHIYDYGVGNIHSLQKALEKAGASVQVTREPAELESTDVAVLPGVGAFGAVMESLEPCRDILQARHDDGHPILGICIGLQALYEGSAEAPGTPGLGILSGHVEPLPPDAGKIPHIGWNQVHMADDPVWYGVPPEADVYYVHSYAIEPDTYTLGTTDYGGPFVAALRRQNTIAFQFHPEKSSLVGHQILDNTVRSLQEQT